MSTPARTIAPGARAAPGRIAALRAVVFTVALLPLARLFVLGSTDGLGANPVEFVQRSTGTWTLVMLCLVLSVTPLRRIAGWNALIRVRRMLGLYVFFYACLHVTSYVWFDQWFDVGAIAKDIAKRPFITAGFAAFLLLVPLAATSTDAMIRRLGRRWSELHRAVYAVAVLAMLHYWWHKAGKNDFFEPSIYGAILATLLGWRVWWARRSARGKTR